MYQLSFYRCSSLQCLFFRKFDRRENEAPYSCFDSNDTTNRCSLNRALQQLSYHNLVKLDLGIENSAVGWILQAADRRFLDPFFADSIEKKLSNGADYTPNR